MGTCLEFFEDKVKFECGPFDVKYILENKTPGYVVVDVRAAEDYSQGHLPTAINAPAKEIEQHVAKLPKDKKLILYCYHDNCFAAPRTCLKLAKQGFNVMEMLGGFQEWKESGYLVETL